MAEEKLDEASKGKKNESVRFVCKTKCYWNGELYHEGDILVMDKDDKTKVPEHFEKVES